MDQRSEPECQQQVSRQNEYVSPCGAPTLPRCAPMRLFADTAALIRRIISCRLTEVADVLFVSDCMQVEVIRTYTAKQPDELSLQVADVVLVSQTVEDGTRIPFFFF